MRTIRTATLTALLVAAFVAPGAAAAAMPAASLHRIAVDGTFHGDGGYELGCDTVYVTGSGTFDSPGLGRGTYRFRVCLTIGGPTYPLVGAMTLTPNHGGTISGSIKSVYTPGDGFVLPVVIAGGTRPFAHAQGTLTMGPFVESHFTNCDPRGPCLNWKDAGPITGTITHVAS